MGDSVLKRPEYYFPHGRRPRSNRAFERLRFSRNRGDAHHKCRHRPSQHSQQQAPRGGDEGGGEDIETRVEGRLSTHKATFRVNSCAGGAGWPSASVAGRNSNVASMLAIVIHTVSHARARPGHLRRPKPNTASGEGARPAGSESRNRSGLNFEGSG